MMPWAGRKLGANSCIGLYNPVTLLSAPAHLTLWLAMSILFEFKLPSVSICSSWSCSTRPFSGGGRCLLPALQDELGGAQAPSTGPKSMTLYSARFMTDRHCNTKPAFSNITVLQLWFPYSEIFAMLSSGHLKKKLMKWPWHTGQIYTLISIPHQCNIASSR